ncbi:hypothetical protein [Shewanella sp. 0m-4]
MTTPTRQLNISISEDKIAKLIQQGVLCAADFKCLDSDTKKAVWQLCLWSCEKRIHCDKQCQDHCKNQCAIAESPDVQSPNVQKIDVLSSDVQSSELILMSQTVT